MENAENLAQAAVERLSEDEALRGNLTDEGFGPLLEWAANAAIAYAQNLQSDKPEEAMDSYASRLKSVLQEAVADAEAGKIDDPQALLNFEMGDRAATEQELSELKLAPNAADDNAVKIAGLLANALNKAATKPEPTQSSKPSQAEASQSETEAKKPSGEQDSGPGATPVPTAPSASKGQSHPKKDPTLKTERRIEAKNEANKSRRISS